MNTQSKPFLPTRIEFNADRSTFEGIQESHKRLYYNIKVTSSISSKTRGWSIDVKKEVNIVLTNLLACVRKGKDLAYSRNCRHKINKRYNPKNINARRVIKAIDFLTDKEYCLNHIASNKQNPRKPMVSSYIQPTQKFIDEFCSSDEAAVIAEHAHMAAKEVVILRDIDGNEIDYVDNDKTEEARALIVKLNTISYNSVFTKRNGAEMDNFVLRIFNMGDFACGGRFAHSEIGTCQTRKTSDCIFVLTMNLLLK